jgi:hypothetical protein
MACPSSTQHAGNGGSGCAVSAEDQPPRLVGAQRGERHVDATEETKPNAVIVARRRLAEKSVPPNQSTAGEGVAAISTGS